MLPFALIKKENLEKFMELSKARLQGKDIEKKFYGLRNWDVVDFDLENIEDVLSEAYRYRVKEDVPFGQLPIGDLFKHEGLPHVYMKIDAVNSLHHPGVIDNCVNLFTGKTDRFGFNELVKSKHPRTTDIKEQ